MFITCHWRWGCLAFIWSITAAEYYRSNTCKLSRPRSRRTFSCSHRYWEHSYTLHYVTLHQHDYSHIQDVIYVIPLKTFLLRMVIGNRDPRTWKIIEVRPVGGMNTYKLSSVHACSWMSFGQTYQSKVDFSPSLSNGQYVPDKHWRNRHKFQA